MKHSGIALAVSLAGNAVLVSAVALQPSLVPPRIREVLSFGAYTREMPADRAASKGRIASAPRKLWPLLATENVTTLLARLRAAGFPPTVIRDMIRAEINARYDARIAAVVDPDPDTPFWKLLPSGFSFGTKRAEEYSQIQRERAKLLRELFDDPFFTTDDVSSAQRRQFGNLSRQKIDLIQRVEDDYAEMMSAVRAATKGIMLPEDREKLAFLTREKRDDLAAVLSPAELAEYEVRNSPITRSLSHELANFKPNEAEFRAIFSVQQQLNDKFPYVPGVRTDFEGRRTTQVQLSEQLKITLGERRFADYLRETSDDFHQLKRLVQRENLSPDAAVRAFDLRHVVSQNSVRIVDDPALTVEQKRAALGTLAKNTRDQIIATLGPVAGPTFLNTVNHQWLNGVERGAAVTFIGMPNRMTGSDSVMISLGSSATLRNLPVVSPPTSRP